MSVETIQKQNNMKLLQPFKRLPQGYYRLIIVGWVVTPILSFMFLMTHSSGLGLAKLDYYVTFFLFYFIYYVLARFGVWIYEGFKNQKK